MEPAAFSTSALPGIPTWERDIDVFAPPELLTTLQERTGATSLQVLATTLRGFEGVLFESLSQNGRTPWVLPLGVRSTRRRRHGLQFCPRCLSESLYFRRSWRLAFSVACTRHYCLLFDACPKCDAPIEIHRRFDGSKRSTWASSLGQCCQCGTDLARARALRIASNHRLIQHQRMLERALVDGSVMVGDQQIRTLLFFKGLQTLSLAAISSKVGSQIQFELDTIGRRSDAPWTTGGQKFIEELPLDTRFCIVDTVPILLEEWPKRFLDFANRVGLTASRIATIDSKMPYWLSSVVREHLYRPGYVPNEAELISVATYLNARGRPITRRALREFVGVRFDKRPKMWRRIGRLAKTTTPPEPMDYR